MAKINLGRVILGGIVAGIVIDVIEFVLNGILLDHQWVDLMTGINRAPLGMGAVTYFELLGLLQGLVAVWTYAAIRPRFGAGVKTAVYAALPNWILGYFVTDMFPTIMGVIPLSMTVIMLAVGFVEIILATIAGAWLYKEA
jgi:hypothetical protein